MKIIKEAAHEISNIPNDLLELQSDWYGYVDDIVDEIEDLGYDVLDYNNEWITVSDPENDDDTEYVLKLGGTERTITIDNIRVI